MTRETHSVEPWEVVDGTDVFAEKAPEGAKLPAICYGENDEANARRIVACVNASTGIGTETLETAEEPLACGALAAIHKLLDDGGIPRGTFADDHVRNLVALYNQSREHADAAEAMLEWLDSRGGLGVEVHERIRAFFNKEPKP